MPLAVSIPKIIWLIRRLLCEAQLYSKSPFLFNQF